MIGNALDRPGQLSLPPATPSSGGVYAPTPRHHDGRFWLITTNVAPGGSSFIVTADDPAGPWSDPVEVPGIGIDPDLAWDDDGNCWCTYAEIGQVRIDPATGATLDGPYPPARSACASTSSPPPPAGNPARAPTNWTWASKRRPATS